ncbi:MAG: hypothetical protein KatS3mg012_0051 [Gaiellaceae bacterium]|nr:MAG: hypothetical protein KatS3mg012_0051 [Gaiellaceae bacterium]
MERLGDEVSRALGRAGGGGAQALPEIVRAWPGVVGEAIARQAWPLRVGRDGALHVATSSSTWAFELDRLAPEILARLQAALGEGAPSGLRFRPGPLPEQASAPRPPQTPPQVAPPTSEELAAAEELASAIEDPELRALVSRAARASLAKARSDQRI